MRCGIFWRKVQGKIWGNTVEDFLKHLILNNFLSLAPLPSTVLPSNPSGQCHIFWHESDSFGVNGAQQTVLKQSHQIRLRCFLKHSCNKDFGGGLC